MYGTVALCSVTAENVEKLRELFASEDYGAVDGYVSTDLMVPNNHEGTLLMVVRFRDRASYEANGDSPEQHQRYLAMRALMEADPVWYDGDWVTEA